MKKLSADLQRKWRKFRTPDSYNPVYDTRTYTDADYDLNSTATISPKLRYEPSFWMTFNRSERRELAKAGCIRYNYETQTYDILK